jgi:hypothetical protein
MKLIKRMRSPTFRERATRHGRKGNNNVANYLILPVGQAEVVFWCSSNWEIAHQISGGRERGTSVCLSVSRIFAVSDHPRSTSTTEHGIIESASPSSAHFLWHLAPHPVFLQTTPAHANSVVKVRSVPSGRTKTVRRHSQARHTSHQANNQDTEKPHNEGEGGRCIETHGRTLLLALRDTPDELSARRAVSRRREIGLLKIVLHRARALGVRHGIFPAQERNRHVHAEVHDGLNIVCRYRASRATSFAQNARNYVFSFFQIHRYLDWLLRHIEIDSD